MIQTNRSPDKHTFLVDNNRSRTGKVFKFSGSLLLISAICALCIWTFTPVSEEADYKLVQAQKTIDIKASPDPAQAAVDIKAAADNSDIKTSPNTASEPAPALSALIPTRSFEATESPVLTLAAEKPDTPGLKLKTFEFDSVPEIFAQEKVSEMLSDSPKLTNTANYNGRVETITIESGDTLTRIFSRTSLPISQAIKLAGEEAASQLNRLSIGKTMRIYFDENKQWEILEYDTDKLNTLIVAQNQGEFQISQHEKQVEYRTFTAHGTIDSSLGMAAENAGVSNTITQSLVDIYKWEVDFARDIRAGDTFSVVYQKAYIENQFIADGPILAASFSNGGRSIEAIRYTDSTGNTAYFQPDGESLRRGFLRTPVTLARITSGFGKRRHPIKKTWKKHLGVDYGASRGTPILATADGVVQYAGKKGGYGNTVILRHGGIYTTLYAHMSKTGKGIRSGKAVTQGQVIGYVGRTGWATGDHLHYEFRINGQHKNPLKVKLPKTNPLAKKEMDTFTDQAEPLLGTLTSLKAAQLATLESEETQPTL